MTAKPVLLLQLGFGHTGRALVQHYLGQAARYPQVRYLGVGDRGGLWLIPDGWSPAMLQEAYDFKNAGMPISRWRPDSFGAELIPARDAYTSNLLWRLDELGIRRATVVDVTAPASGTAPLLTDLRRGGYDVVLANRAPLAGGQAAYDALTGPARGRLRWTGAGGLPLPLGPVLRRAARAGHPVRALTAMTSPALGRILAAVAAGGRFSEAVGEAARAGLLHADPREDLNGLDTARTALLLGRAAGWRLEPEHLQVQGLLPAGFETLPVPAVWARLPDLDRFFADRAWAAGERRLVLRYLAQVGPDGGMVSLETIPADSLAGRLEPGDTFAAFLAEGRDPARPVVVQGPGGDPAGTAAAVFADLIESPSSG